MEVIGIFAPSLSTPSVTDSLLVFLFSLITPPFPHSLHKDRYAEVGLAEGAVRACEALSGAAALKANELLSVIERSWEGFKVLCGWSSQRVISHT